MMDKVAFRCRRCGNAILTPREAEEIPAVREVSTSFCNLCEIGGEFMETFCTLRDGREICWPQLKDIGAELSRLPGKVGE